MRAITNIMPAKIIATAQNCRIVFTVKNTKGSGFSVCCFCMSEYSFSSFDTE